MSRPEQQAQAVALAYGSGDAAPRVVAKGRGLIAQEIIDRARELGIWVHQSPELLALLMQVDLDDHIPPQLYVAVAELLAWLYRLEHASGPAELASIIAGPPPLAPPPEPEPASHPPR